MRKPRRKENSELRGATYHLYTRTVNRELFFFHNKEKAMMQRFAWAAAEYGGLKLSTHSVMSNHPHLEVYVPKKEPVSDAEILRFYEILHSVTPSVYSMSKLATMKKIYQETGTLPDGWRQSQLAMMGDITPFMQLFKQMYTVWYNRTHNRIGPLWNERFKSEIFHETASQRALARYIDLNPCRAGLCQDPKDYPYCGYAAAVAGDPRAQAGLTMVVGGETWDETHSLYRIMLYEEGSKAREGKAHISQKDYEKVLAAGGKLTEAEVRLCCHCYLTNAEAIGTADSVQSQIDAYREQTGRGQRLRPFPIPSGLGLDGLYVMSRPRLRKF